MMELGIVLYSLVTATESTTTAVVSTAVESAVTGKSVRALCTHPILSSGAYNKINNSGLSEVVVTDTIPIKEGLSEKITVLKNDW